MNSSDLRPPGGRGEDSRLEKAIAFYIDRLNSGERLVPEEILAENADLGVRILEGLEGFIDLEAAQTAPAPFRVLGDYRLIRQIGRGGMGVVYEAWEGSMERRVALKVLPAGIAADTRTFTRFCREAKLAGKLHHPNIVPVYGMGIQEDTPHYAMLTGQSPRRFLRS